VNVMIRESNASRTANQELVLGRNIQS